MPAVETEDKQERSAFSFDYRMEETIQGRCIPKRQMMALTVLPQSNVFESNGSPCFSFRTRRSTGTIRLAKAAPLGPEKKWEFLFLRITPRFTKVHVDRFVCAREGVQICIVIIVRRGFRIQ
eukprot:scaffold19392_cov221-Amphora_coffeaeformis.AAC.2